MASMMFAHRSIKKWSGSLNIDTTMKQLQKSLKKLSCGNALITFSAVVSDAKNFDNMHESQLLAMTYCSELTLDTAAFSCLSKLSEMTDSNFDP